MPGTVVVGAQWGDEGKGKIIDVMSAGFYRVVRFGGGDNAGHSIERNGVRVATHLLPSAIFRPRRSLYLARGMVINFEVLVQEIEAIKAVGGLENATIYVDLDAHIVTETHKYVDGERNQHLGTTRRGIGPAYEDRVARRGIRVRDLLTADPKHYEKAMQRLRAMDFVRFVDTSEILYDKLSDDIPVLFEGAQGALLDIFHGIYPYVTSSHTVASAAATSCGLPMRFMKHVLGVSKAYTTRVGAGPFPTELEDETGARLRELGGEYGATTGRARRCGWLDIPALRYAIRVSGIDYLALTKLDILSGFEKVQVCLSYKVGQATHKVLNPGLPFDQIKPVYETLAGWDKFKPTKYFTDLPDEARAYVRHVEELVGVRVAIVSVGADTSATILRNSRELFDHR